MWFLSVNLLPRVLTRGFIGPDMSHATRAVTYLYRSAGRIESCQWWLAEPVNLERMLVANKHQSGGGRPRSCIGLDHSWYR